MHALRLSANRWADKKHGRNWNMTDASVNYRMCSDTDEMSRLLGEVFAERDPPAVAVGLTAAEFETFVPKLGFNERVRQSYRDHQFEGHRFFTSIADQGGPMLLERSLGV